MVPIIIANWKMQLGVQEVKNLTQEIKGSNFGRKEIVVCPTFVSLLAVKDILAKSSIKLGAQDCFWESRGAYTGEVSAQELKEAGCEFVIIGHSERRQYLSESDEMIHRKVKAAIDAGLTPILCVGETFDQRQQGARDYVLIHQVTRALEGLSPNFTQRIIVAYEPVWVIGSGQAVLPGDAASASQVIRQTLFDLFAPDLVKKNFFIIYGGSVDENNVEGFMATNNIDGFLVGGASLKANKFIDLIKNIN